MTVLSNHVFAALSSLVGEKMAETMVRDPAVAYFIKSDGHEFQLRCNPQNGEYWRIDVSKAGNLAFAIYKSVDAICWVRVVNGPQLPIGRLQLMESLRNQDEKASIRLLLRMLEMMGVDTRVPPAEQYPRETFHASGGDGGNEL